MIIDNINLISKEDLLGKVIAFPTDTVFGVGAIISDIEAINKIYKLKNRDYSKPLAILASKVDDIIPYIENVSQEVLDIMNKYWPGALTIIFKKSNLVDKVVTNNLETIAFRIPASKVAQEVLDKYGPLAVTSVNLSGEVPLNSYEEIEKTFGKDIDYIVAKNEPSSNVSSTIIDVTNKDIKIIRYGEVKILN